MEFEIIRADTAKPEPKARMSWPWRKMSMGDKVVIPKKHVQMARASCHSYSRLHNMAFKTTPMLDGAVEFEVVQHKPKKTKSKPVIPERTESGVPGVIWHKTHLRWMAHIRVSTKRIHLGYFTDLGDAIKARQDAVDEFSAKSRVKKSKIKMEAPAGPRSRISWPWKDMAVGHEVDIPKDLVQRAQISCHVYGRAVNKKFKTKTQSDGALVVTRIA